MSLASSPPGAGVLVTTVVAGGIAILRPFTAASRPFLRDIIFYMVAVFLIFTALYLGRVTLAWALGEQPPVQGHPRAGGVAGTAGQERLLAGHRHRVPLVPSDGNPTQGSLSENGNTWFT